MAASTILLCKQTVTNTSVSLGLGSKCVITQIKPFAFSTNLKAA